MTPEKEMQSSDNPARTKAFKGKGKGREGKEKGHQRKQIGLCVLLQGEVDGYTDSSKRFGTYSKISDSEVLISPRSHQPLPFDSIYEMI